MDDYQEIMNRIQSGDLATLEEIEAMIDDFPNGRDEFIGRHWLTNAIDCGPVEVVQWMLDRGVEVNFNFDDGYSALHSALEREEPLRYELLRLLIKNGADVNVRGIHDWTPAHLAAARDDVPALEILRDSGADLTIQTRIDNYATPLQEAVELGRSPNAVRYLQSFSEPGEGCNGITRRC